MQSLWNIIFFVIGLLSIFIGVFITDRTQIEPIVSPSPIVTINVSPDESSWFTIPPFKGTGRSVDPIGIELPFTEFLLQGYGLGQTGGPWFAIPAQSATSYNSTFNEFTARLFSSHYLTEVVVGIHITCRNNAEIIPVGTDEFKFQVMEEDGVTPIHGGYENSDYSTTAVITTTSNTDTPAYTCRYTFAETLTPGRIFILKGIPMTTLDFPMKLIVTGHYFE